VYILVRVDRCKIGLSRSAVRRTRAIKVQGGIEDARLHLAFPVARSLAATIEDRAHEVLAGRRIMGEWFRVTVDEAAEAVEQAILAVTRKQAVGSDPLVQRRDALTPRTPEETRALIGRRIERMKAGLDPRAGESA
jgi:hypothetical protein